MALDAVQRAHDAELRNINEKVRSISGSSVTNVAQTNVFGESRTDVQSARHW